MAHPFSGLGNTHEFRTGREIRQYEEVVTGALLYELKLGWAKSDIIKATSRLRGNVRGLSLQGLVHRFPELPFNFTLFTKPLKCTVEQLFHKFDRQNFVQRFYEELDELPEDRNAYPLAMFVKWPYVPVGLVLHNYDGINGGTVRMVYDPKRGDTLYLEPFKQFVKHGIKPQWATEGLEPEDD